jgi:hypothetical protein
MTYLLQFHYKALQGQSHGLAAEWAEDLSLAAAADALLHTVCVLCVAVQGQSHGLAAEWAEELSLDVSPEGLAAADALLLLEVVQLPSGFARFKVCDSAT